MDDVGIDRKLVILGCTDVGKTSITMRYCHNSFTTPTSATIGASFLQKRLVVDGLKMTLQIWDTAGQERFRSMAPMYYRNAKAAILVFDLTKESTFEKIKEWLDDLRRHVDHDIALAVVGNKCDAQTSFDIEKAKAFSEDIGAQLYLTSAKSGEGISELFDGVTRLLLKKHQQELLRNNSEINDNNRDHTLRLDEHSKSGSSDRKCC